jgi:hypothetical protein
MKKIARRASILVTAAVVVCATAASAFAQDASSRCAPREISRSELLALDLESLLDIKVVTASLFSESQSDAPGIISVVSQDELRRFGGTTLREVRESFCRRARPTSLTAAWSRRVAIRPRSTADTGGRSRGLPRATSLASPTIAICCGCATLECSRHHARPNGGCSSGVERLTVAQEVAGSKPVTHPIPPLSSELLRKLSESRHLDHQMDHGIRQSRLQRTRLRTAPSLRHGAVSREALAHDGADRREDLPKANQRSGRRAHFGADPPRPGSLARNRRKPALQDGHWCDSSNAAAEMRDSGEVGTCAHHAGNSCGTRTTRSATTSRCGQSLGDDPRGANLLDAPVREAGRSNREGFESPLPHQRRTEPGFPGSFSCRLWKSYRLATDKSQTIRLLPATCEASFTVPIAPGSGR